MTPSDNVVIPKKPPQVVLDQYDGEPVVKRSASKQRAAISLPNGTSISPDEANGGHGELKAVNGTAFDACVFVVNSGSNKQVREIYVNAQNSFTLDRLDAGNYRIVFGIGLDWNSSDERFNRNPSYFEFGKRLSFEEYRDSSGLHYNEHSITLHPVLSGNVHSKHLSEIEFHFFVRNTLNIIA